MHDTPGGASMITQDTVLVQLIRLIEHIPSPPPPSARRRGRPIVYSEKLFLKALLIMIVRRLHKVGELLAVLEEPTQEWRWRARDVLDQADQLDKDGILGDHGGASGSIVLGHTPSSEAFRVGSSLDAVPSYL